MGCGRLDAAGDAAELVHERHAGGAQRGAEGLPVLVAGGDDRHLEHVGQHLGHVQGAVAFARAHVDVDAVEPQMQAVEDHGAQDGAVHPRDAGGGLVHGRGHLRFVEVDNHVASTVEFGDHGQRRHADNAHPLDHYTSSRISSRNPVMPMTTWTDTAAASGLR